MLSVILLVTNLVFAQDTDLNTLKAENARLKAEITQLKNKLNETQIEVGDLEMALEDVKNELSEKAPVIIQTKLQPVMVYRVNRLSVLTGSQSNRDGLLTGVQYQRMLNSRFSFGGQVQSNDSVLLNLGFEF
jgi:septal ring factor EnvC (AmiA/AmiB activator)